jgi:ribose transport system substrate-binding protein
MDLKVKFATITGTKEPAPEASLKGDKPYKVAFFVKNVVNPFWKAARKGADDAAAKFGVQVAHYAPTQADNVPEQTRIMEDVLTKKDADAICWAPVDFKAQVAVAEKANAAKVPIFNFNSKLAGGEIVTFAGTDDFNMGKGVIDYMQKVLSQKGSMIILDGVPGATTAELRKQGIAEELKKYPNLKVVAQQTANFSRAEALRVTENLLQSQPNVDAIVTTNDEMALGAVAALDSSGKAGKIKVTGVDATPDGLVAIKDGKLFATVDYSAYVIGYKSVEFAVRYLNGEKMPKQEYLVDYRMVDKTNVDDAIANRKQIGLMQ